VRSIFDNPSPPRAVWERQFDYCDDGLRNLARTPYEEIEPSDLWYYFHDLAYVQLQPDLFDYLFPVCLMDWKSTLMNNEACSHGDSELHYGLLRGRIFEKMLTPQRRDEVVEFIRDCFAERLDMEQEFAQLRSQAPTYCWIHRFNSLGIVLPKIEPIWNVLWSLETPGRAIAAMQYCSGLMYFGGDNPLFDVWDGISPDLWQHDAMIYNAGWNDDNLEFLSQTLTVDFVNDKVTAAVNRLKREPAGETARQLEDNLPDCQELIAERVRELPSLLRDPNAAGWTV
jgi:hypothetical protein